MFSPVSPIPLDVVSQLYFCRTHDLWFLTVCSSLTDLPPPPLCTMRACFCITVMFVRSLFRFPRFLNHILNISCFSQSKKTVQKTGDKNKTSKLKHERVTLSCKLSVPAFFQISETDQQITKAAASILKQSDC